MPEPIFQICGTTVPPLLGRDAILQRMLAALTKPVPSNLQVVGARFAGKTVLLHALAARLRLPGSPYTAVVLWDLGHLTPPDDAQFMQRLARELAAALSINQPSYAGYLRDAINDHYGAVAEVLDQLEQENQRTLVIMDGFDKALANGGLSRNLWDQLRGLAERRSLRLITASRLSLRELIRHPDAQTSDFWNIFDATPVRVGCLDETDLAAIRARLPGLELSPGSRTELLNASNGYPIFVLEICNALVAAGAAGMISDADMRSAIAAGYDILQDKIDALWHDCNQNSKDLFEVLLKQHTLAHASFPAADARTLVERGFAQLEGNTLQKPSRLVQQYLGQRQHDGSAMARLFGRPEDYASNLRGVLERRISQAAGMDADLCRILLRGASDLPEDPGSWFSNVRRFVNLAFERIWSVEIPNRKIPSEWISTWKYNSETGIDRFESSFPQGTLRLQLLRLMTGTAKVNRCARHVTKRSYVLLNAVNAAGDFGQHDEGAPVDAHTAYAVLHLCIELAAVLAQELPPTGTR